VLLGHARRETVTTYLHLSSAHLRACVYGMPSATNVVTLCGSSDAEKEPFVTVTGPSPASFLVLEVVYLWALAKAPPVMVWFCLLADQDHNDVLGSRIRMDAHVALGLAHPIDRTDIANALSLFNPVWNGLKPREQAPVLHLLIDHIDYDGEAGEIVISASGKRT
jgi:hypothetical protein